MPLSITLEQTSSRKQRTSHVTKPKRTVRIGSVRLPKWFLQRQYDVQLLYATSGWPFSLNACGVVQHDSPFFNACRTGDIETIKFILSNQQASIYDRDSHGFTAFHCAIGNRQLELCKLLRHAGIFAQFDYSDYYKSLFSLNWSLDDFAELDSSLLRIAAPLKEPDRDWFEEYCQLTDNDGTANCVIMELFSLLSSAQSDTSILSVSYLRSYFEFRTRHPYICNYRSFMSYIARVLSNNSTAREITAAREKCSWIVWALAREIAREYLKDHLRLDDQWLHSASQALCAVARAGLNPHQTSGKLESVRAADNWYQNASLTPLGFLCVETMRVQLVMRQETQSESERNKHLRKRLHAWLSGLYSAGVDLLQYAESESACYGHCPDLLIIPWETHESIMVATGPTPEDWHFSFWHPCEPYARLFWCLVEGTPFVHRLIVRILETYYAISASQDPTGCELPGSWPSEEARIAEELEDLLLLIRTDGHLDQIEEDLSLLSEADFFAEWDHIYDILRRRK
jgi:hypothetical protein